MEKKNLSNRKKPLENYIKYSSLGVQMILTLCLAAWGGIWLDRYFKVESHLFTVFLMLFAVVATIYSVIKSLSDNGKP